MAGNMAQRREMRAIQNEEEINLEKSITGFEAFRWEVAKKWRKTRRILTEIRYRLTLWRESIKDIEGRYGSGIGSFFLLVRWLLFLNLFISLIMFIMVYLPQKSGGQLTDTTNLNNETKTPSAWYIDAQALFSGRGFMENTELFYGVYTEKNIGGYDFPFVYLLAVGAVLLGCFLILLYSMGISSIKSFDDRKEISKARSGYSYFHQAFGGWEFSISETRTAKLRACAISTDFEEEVRTQTAVLMKRTRREMLKLYPFRVLTSSVVLMFYSACGISIYYAFTSVTEDAIYEKDIKSNETLSYNESVDLFFREMAATLTISAYCLFLPPLFELIAKFEKWRVPQVEYQITLIRTYILKMGSVTSLIIYTFTKVKPCQEATCARPCWETFAGQKIYQVMVVTFIVMIIKDLIYDTLVRKVREKSQYLKDRTNQFEFEIASNVLEVQYAQAIVWLGFYYAPLISVGMVFFLFGMFYVKKFTLFRNTAPPTKIFRSDRRNFVFQTLLLVTLVLSLLPIGYTITGLQPSPLCGPFRDKKNPYSIIPEIIDDSPPVTREILGFIGSPGFIVPAFFVLVIFIIRLIVTIKTLQKRLKLHKTVIVQDEGNQQFLKAKMQRMDKTFNKIRNSDHMSELNPLIRV